MKRLVLTSSMALAILSISAAHAAGKGQLDPKFSADGMAEAAIDIDGDLDDNVFAQVVGRGGSTYVVGIAQASDDGSHRSLAIAKFQHDGTLDATYGDGGRVIFDMPGKTVIQSHAALTADGNLVVGMLSHPDHFGFIGNELSFVCRFGKTGKLDTFGKQGCTQVRTTSTMEGLPHPDYASLRSIALRPDGGILLGGEFITSTGATQSGIASLTADGKKLDAEFGAAGILYLPGLQYGITQLKVAPDATVVGLGLTEIDNTRGAAFVKIDSLTGMPAAFGDEGILTPDLPTTYASQQVYAFDYSISAAGTSIFFTGASTEGNAHRAFVGKLSGTGVLESNFGNGGIVEFEKKNGGRSLCGVLAVEDGVVASGASNIIYPGQFSGWNAVKLDQHGQIDFSFGDNLGGRYPSAAGRRVPNSKPRGSIDDGQPQHRHRAERG